MLHCIFNTEATTIILDSSTDGSVLSHGLNYNVYTNLQSHSTGREGRVAKPQRAQAGSVLKAFVLAY